MNKESFNNIGWLLMIGLAFAWFKIGYSNWYPLIILLAYISFSVADGSIKKLAKLKEVPYGKIALILLSFLVSVAMVLGLIFFANYLIKNVWELSGSLKMIAEILAIIISLYPVKFTFGSLVYKLTEDLWTE